MRILRVCVDSFQFVVGAGTLLSHVDLGDYLDMKVEGHLTLIVACYSLSLYWIVAQTVGDLFV